MKMIHLNLTLVLLLFIITVMTACRPDGVTPSGGEVGYLTIRLTDDPGDYQQVNIDLLQVRARMTPSGGGSNWYDLQTQSGIYDLLTLQQGLDTLIVNDSLPPGELEELRLILGDNNTVMIDSVLRPLKVPSGSSSGLKIKLQQVLVRDSLSTVLLDFDAGASIVAKGNGGFNLKPVIRVLP
jgi:hypothetical protein